MNQPVRIKDLDIFEAYVNERQRKFVACSLLTFGYTQFKRSVVIKKLNELALFYGSEEYKDFQKAKIFLAEFLFENLIDTIRIGICFENYFKAKLLLNGFVIHVIKGDNSLKKQQKTRPIHIDEIVSQESKDKLKEIKKMLDERTIGYNVLLAKESYLRYFNVEYESIEFLKILNAKRNTLHFYMVDGMSLSKSIIGKYVKLNGIIDLDISVLQNVLMKEIAPDGKTILPIKSNV